MKLRFFQPSWIQIRAAGKVIYIDPAFLKKYYDRHPGAVVFTSWPDPIDGLPETKMAKADLILVTHAHKDHCKAVTVARLTKPGTRVVAPKGCRAELGAGIVEIAEGEARTVAGVKISAVPAWNTPEGGSTRKQHKRGAGVGYVIELAGKRLYHAGDTDLLPEMAKLGPIDVAMLPIDGTFTMTAEDAIEAIRRINPRHVIPMHDMGADRHGFAARAEAETGAKVVPLEIGETLEI